MALDDDVKEFLDEKFDDFIAGLVKKFRWPAIGLAVVFAAFMSAFATYMYVKARSDISTAQVQFYQHMMTSQKEVLELKKQMIFRFNDLIGDLQTDVELAKERLSGIIDEAESIQQEQRTILEHQPGLFEPPVFYPDPIEPEPTIEIPPRAKEEILRKEEESKKEAYKINPDEFLKQQQMQQLVPPRGVTIE